MRDTLTPAAKQIIKNRKRKHMWQKVVRSLAMIVVFCTTYALILPAITMQSDPICGMEAHVHIQDCFEEMAVTELTCTLSENEEHQHDGECWSQTGETLTECICGKEEHSHSESCYPVDEDSSKRLQFHCGFAQHTHHQACSDENGTLACTIAEHIHEAKCAVEDVDTTADVETEDLWVQMAASLSLTGDWAQDLLTLAESQIGYTESEKNLVLSGENLYGYTRYGDWFGNPYMQWDDAFIAFCLNYALIPESSIPRSSDTDRWLEALKEKELTHDPGVSLPQPGSIIFYQNSSGKLSTAIVQKADNNKTNLDKMSYRVIAGDVDGKVAKEVVTLSHITAVCDLSLIQRDGKAPKPVAQSRVHTAETKNYIVTVTCAEGVTLPQGAQLQVSEYAKDSETYIRRCEEAGYELEWLLNIGFWLDGQEVDVEGGFAVEVTSKKGNALGGDITHFADSGTERLEGDADDESVSFTSHGFSDFGGGVASRASGEYTFKTIDAHNGYSSQLQAGVDYVAYVIQNNRIIFLSSNSSGLAAITVNKVNNSDQSNGTWKLSQNQLNTDESNFIWRLVNGNYLATQNDSTRLAMSNGWAGTTGSGSYLFFNDSGVGAQVGTWDNGRSYELRYSDSGSNDYMWRASWYDNNGNKATYAETIYFAQVTGRPGSTEPPTEPPTESPTVPVNNYPHAVHTGEVHINRLRFYNLCEDGEKVVSGLAGCVFEITGPNGYYSTITSDANSEVTLPSGLADGTYTITEISVPEGYIRDTDYQRTFIIKDGNLSSEDTVGTFINHRTEQIVTGKTAEVEDYANRIYKVVLDAYANMREYELEPIDVLFVVDQSNSMLFPSELDDTKHKVTLNLNGSGNASAMDNLQLDKTQVYYIIADPTGSSTVWAVWHDGHGWMCQDASYYAKAKHNNEPGYQDDNELVIFPTYGRSYSEQSTYEKNLNSSPKTRSNGGSLDKDLSGSSLGNYLSANGGSLTFTLYTTDNEYNRLHYLEESLANIIYQLADVNGENRVSLTRFTKVLETCDGPYRLATHADYLVEKVTSIKTSGGTRQDIALEHVYTEHLSDGGEHFDKGVDHTYTLLITDGAPVGTDTEPVGNPDDDAQTDAFGAKDQWGRDKYVSIYGRIKGWGAKIRENSTLMTVGLGMEHVEGGKQVLQEIASNQDFYCAVDDASYLLEFVQKLLFESFRAKERINITADIVDEISESFYPIAWVSRGASTGSHQVLLSDDTRTWVLLEAGDWITLDGMLTTAGASNAAGQLLQREDGTYYVEWKNKDISGQQWKGVVYIKAKEDFIGGNAIDTNKSDAAVSVTVNGQDVVRTMETPTVNVRLLDMNEFHSSVTVYLGDLVNGDGTAPIDALKGFYNDTVFTKLIADGGLPLNKVTAASSDGLEDAVFYLRYAMGRDLTAEEWQLLINGETISIPYIYDDASSHGNVGYFTFSLEKEGNLTYDEHESHTACQPGGEPLTELCKDPAETYTLNVTYTAYRLGRDGRPEGNVNNGSNGPGREVGTGNTIPTGQGQIVKENIHEVHVISGRIEIFKYFTDGLTDEEDRIFTFVLHRLEDGQDTSGDMVQTITIPAGQSQGSASILFDGLKRGTYTVTEAVDEDYAVKEILVLNETNCYSIPGRGGSGKELTFVMGHNVQNRDVIGYDQYGSRYTSYIYPITGVYGVAAFTNGPKIFEAEIPVEKIWSDDPASHVAEPVYLALYLGEAPVADPDGNVRILMLDASDNWKGSFIVPLVDENDTLANYNYSVRELSQVREAAVPGWQTGILEGTGQILYYEKPLEEGHLLHLDGRSYVVSYGSGADGQLTVTNSLGVNLPMTGGVGTHLYTISGVLLILAAALIFGFSQRRIRKGGKTV